jgi:uncharacterized membrane protein YcaP (DUF421 family)
MAGNTYLGIENPGSSYPSFRGEAVMPEVLITSLRAFIAFVTLLIVTRVMGKKQISQLTFFDFIVGITVGSIAAILTTDLSVRPFPQWLAICEWVAFALIAEWIALKDRWWGKVLDGQPTIMVYKGKILEDNLAANRYRVDDLRGQLRQRGIFSLADVEYAILETNGELSVLKKPGLDPVSRDDLKLPPVPTGIAVELIQDSKVISQNLQEIGRDINWLSNELYKQGVTNLGQVAFASVGADGSLYVDKYQDELGSIINPGDYPGIY